MKIIFNEHQLNESSWGSRAKKFADNDFVLGPDGTRYDTKLIVSLVNNACLRLTKVTGGTINDYLDALPIVYTFRVPTMATNSKFILINPGFVMELYNKCGKSDIGVSFVILHEIYHNLFKHFMREEVIFTKDPENYNNHDQANVAQDYEINWAIEHSFLDSNRGEQIFGGVTTACEGLISPKFENMIWEDIYPLVSPDEKTHNPKPKKNIIPLSDDYKSGYKDGWTKAIVELRAKGLIESVIAPKSIIDFFMGLNEAVQSDYDAGFDAGYSAAYQAIMSLIPGPTPPPGPTGLQPPQPPLPPQVNVPEKIDGLEPLKPKFEIDPTQEGGGSNMPSDPNKPVDLDNTPRKIDPNYHGGDPNHNGNDDDNSNGKQKPGSSKGTNPGGDPGTNPGGDPGTNPGGKSNPLGEDPNGNPLDDIPNTVTVGTADGMFDGKEGMNASNDHLSDEEIERIAKEAGYEEPDDENYAGRNDPFKDSDRVLGTLRSLAEKAQPGNVFQQVLERIKNIMEPLKDWREELRKMLVGFFIKYQDAGWSKKRIARGEYGRIREREGETAKRLIFMVDTSGSVVMSGKYLEQITAEIAEIAHKVGARYIDLCQFSTRVYKETSFTYYDFPPSEDFTIEVPGSGGTNYQPCFQYIEDNYIDEGKGFQAVIFFTDTDLTARDIPNENDFSWSNKIVWFLLNDGKDSGRHVEVPYGKMLEVSQNEFNDSLKKSNYMKTDESIKTPRRTLGYDNIFKTSSTKSLNEWVDDEEDEIQDIINNGTVNKETGQIEISDEISQEEARRNTINALKVSGRLEEYKEKILNWIKEQRELGNLVYNYSYYGSDKLFVDDNLDINSSCDLTFSGKLLLNMMNANEIFGKFIMDGRNKRYVSSWPEFISFNKVNGNMRVVNCYLDEFPGFGMPKEVTGNVRYDGLRNLRTLKGGPEKVGGNFIVTRCPNIETLEGAPKEFDGIFMTDDQKFSNEEFYAMVANESYISNKSFDKLIEMRIAAANNFKQTKLNEAFAQRTVVDPVTNKEVIEPSQLSRIFGKRVPEKVYSTDPNTGVRLRDKNGAPMFKYDRYTDTGGQEKIKYEYVNKDALDALKQIPLFWDQIPDEIVRNVRQFDANGKRITKNNADNQSAARRNVTDATEYGVNIYCDKNDKIYIISTGNNKSRYEYVDARGDRQEGTWGNGNSWLWFAPGFFDILTERIALIKVANGESLPTRLSYTKAYGMSTDEAADECTRLGVPYSRNNVRNLSFANPSNFTENHMFAIPEYCCNSYIIKGTGDVDDSSEFAKNFTYLSQRDKRKFLSDDRAKAIAGTYMTDRQLNANDPAVEKYRDKFIVDASFMEGRQVKFSVAKALGTIKNMKQSILDMGLAVRKKVLELANNDEFAPDVTDGYLKRFVQSGYREILNRLSECIVSLEGINSNNSLSNNNVKDVLNVLNNTFKTGRGERLYGVVDYNWYDNYEDVIKKLAVILADIDYKRKGHEEEFAARGRGAFGR